jgi:hypothetical protein
MLKAKFFVKCIVLIIAMTSMACSERTYNNETLLIEWTDTNTGLIFRVTERHMNMIASPIRYRGRY